MHVGAEVYVTIGFVYIAKRLFKNCHRRESHSGYFTRVEKDSAFVGFSIFTRVNLLTASNAVHLHEK